MSVTTIHKVQNMQSLVSYCVTPKKAQTSDERVAKLYCDLGSVEFFLDYAENVIKSHARKIQGYSIVQSFPQHEFDVNNEKHIEYVNDMGRKLAYALYPNSPCIVITHADSKYLHNHIIALNHNLDTDKAIYVNRRVKDVRKVNDELMRQFHLEVCQPSAFSITQGEYWGNKKNGWLDTLKESIDKTLSFATSIQEFHDSLLAEGITPSLYKKNGGLKERFSYKVIDTDNNTHTKRSDKLGEAYTKEAIEKQLLENKRKKDLDSIMPMSEWIKLNESNDKKQSYQQEPPSMESVGILNQRQEILKKKVESNDAFQKEKKEQGEQEMKEKNKLEEIINDKIYQELLKERLAIMNHIERIKEKRKYGIDTDMDDNILESLERKLSVINFRIDNYSVSTTTARPQEKLKESLMFQHSTITKDVEFSL